MTGGPGRWRLVVGVLGLAASAVPVRRNSIGRREQQAFRAVNDRPDWLHRPAWVVMQLGVLGAAPVAAGAAYVAGERRLAIRLVASGLAAWALAKAVKQVVRRGRPATVIPDVRHRGPESSGLGYLSGHAAVSMTLILVAAPDLGRPARRVALAAVPLVGLSRIYVGAHLPLDVVGGASLGLLVADAAGRLETHALAAPGRA